MRKLTLTLALFALLGVAQARFYIGFPTSGIVGSAFGVVSGLHIGTYKLYEDFGVRATAEIGTAINIPLDLASLVAYEGGVDGTYSFGEGVVFYTGAGLGYGGGPLASGSVFASAFVGLDFDASSVISIFLEINPRYYFSNSGLIHIRSGLNFHIGDPDDNPVAQPDDDAVWLEPYDEGDAEPNG